MTHYNHKKGVDTYHQGDSNRNIGDNRHNSIQVKQHEDLWKSSRFDMKYKYTMKSQQTIASKLANMGSKQWMS